MRRFHDTIRAKMGAHSGTIIRFLNECEISDWSDLTKSNLNEFRDLVYERVAQSSARTYFAEFKAFLARYEDDIDFCKDYSTILRAKNEKPIKVFLTIKDLEKLERVEVKSEVEQYVLDEFLIGAYTGMRISDAMEVSEENMSNGYLSYVSIKTNIQAVVPLKPGISERIMRVQSNEGVSLAGYNKALRRLAKRVGLNEKVKVFKGGEHLKGEKWEYVSSHTARISFATNLSILGVPIVDIAKLMGHKDIQTTMRYIVNTKANISERAMKFFQ